MSFKKRVLAAAQVLVAAGMVAALVAACGGGPTSSGGFSQAYTSTAGVGEVLNFSIDTGKMTYTYTVNYTSYSASGVSAGQTGSGSLLSQNPGGSYNLAPSNDGFISGGILLPLQNGLLVGHVQISLFGTARIPVFGVSHPITTVAGLAGTYNYQGFSCSVRGVANVSGNTACASHEGTITVAASGVYNVCNGGDINNTAAHPCWTTASGVIAALPATPGVFDYRNSNGHIGWFFAFTAPNGQNVAVIDHDDTFALQWGHTVASTYASSVSGTMDGKYFVKNNEGAASLLAVSGVSLTDTSLLPIPGITVTGSLVLNYLWPGMNFYQFVDSLGTVVASGVSMTAGTGVDTYIRYGDPAFGVGIRYSP